MEDNKELIRIKNELCEHTNSVNRDISKTCRNTHVNFVGKTGSNGSNSPSKANITKMSAYTIRLHLCRMDQDSIVYGNDGPLVPVEP